MLKETKKEDFMFKAKKLDKLVAAGIISAKQRQQILDFDKDKNAGFVSRLIILLGIFTIGIGVVSIVASNWETISDAVKLTMMFAAIFGCGAWAGTCYQKGAVDTAEKLLVGLFLLSAAAIGLIIQVYQLSGGKWYSVLAIWFLVTSPLLFAAKKTCVAQFWTPVFLCWCCCYFIDMLSPRWYLFYGSSYGVAELCILALFAAFVFIGKMMILYVPKFSLGQVLHKDAIFAAYLVFFMYVVTSWGGWNQHYGVPFIRLLIATAILVISSFIYRYYGSYQLIRRNIKFGGLVVIMFYIHVADRLGLLNSGIGLIFGGIGLLILVKSWPLIIRVVTGEKKDA